MSVKSYTIAGGFRFFFGFLVCLCLRSAIDFVETDAVHNVTSCHFWVSVVGVKIDSF